MNKKKIRVLLCSFQVLLVSMIFAPVGGGGDVDSASKVLHLYNGEGFGADVRVFLFLALGIPLAIVLSLFLMKERKNYGLGACLGALLTVVHAVFFSSIRAGSSIPLTFFMQARFYFLVLLALLTMLTESFAFLSTPRQGKEKQ